MIPSGHCSKGKEQSAPAYPESQLHMPLSPQNPLGTQSLGHCDNTNGATTTNQQYRTIFDKVFVHSRNMPSGETGIKQVGFSFVVAEHYHSNHAKSFFPKPAAVNSFGANVRLQVSGVLGASSKCNVWTYSIYCTNQLGTRSAYVRVRSKMEFHRFRWARYCMHTRDPRLTAGHKSELRKNFHVGKICITVHLLGNCKGTHSPHIYSWMPCLH